MKIIHTADLHIDSKMETNLDRTQAGQRRSELLDTFERMVAFADENGVRVILIAGDLFDKPHIRKNAKRRVLEQITGHPGIDFVYLRGNHDNSDFLSDLDPSEIPSNLKLFSDDKWTSYVYGSVVITGREITDENCKMLPVNLILDQADFNIVTLHGQETNYVGKDRTQIIHIPEFKNKNIDYLALGHIHSYKCDRLDDRGEYCYAGCPEGRGFDECGQKGFVLLNIDEENKELYHEFIPFAKRILHEITVEVT
ncbi:MAG: DNA repair exonuclease, partial [Lachnospiraceae bacterium]|nr:DNA repair exonuclease [Lachnospiraceae bacterium]